MAVVAPRRPWSKLGRVALTLTMIAAGCLALGGLAAAQKPKTPPVAATPAPTATAAPVVSPPPGPEKVSGNQPAWTVNCFATARTAVLDCKIEQRLFAKETGRILSIAVIEIPGKTRQPALLLHLPNGLALQAGASLAIDGGSATPLLWQSCDGNGCYATLALTPALLGSMKAGKVMTINAVAANRQPLTFQHLLTDFAAAYEAAK